MKRVVAAVVVLLLIGACDPKPQNASSASATAGTASIDVRFSPNGGCTEKVVAEIGLARGKLRVQAYTFTSAPIAKAILDAKKRGVDCDVILDKSQLSERYSELDFFFNEGVPVLVDAKHAIAHNKIMIIDDGETIITGSFNFTKAAEESNAENLLVLKGYAELAAKYRENYAVHRGHSAPYAGKTDGESDERPARKRSRRRAPAG